MNWMIFTVCVIAAIFYLLMIFLLFRKNETPNEPVVGVLKLISSEQKVEITLTDIPRTKFIRLRVITDLNDEKMN